MIHVAYVNCLSCISISACSIG